MYGFVLSGFAGEADQYGMYPSSRVKRRPAPYEVEISDGRSILDLSKYGKPLFGCAFLFSLISNFPPSSQSQSRHLK